MVMGLARPAPRVLGTLTPLTGVHIALMAASVGIGISATVNARLAAAAAGAMLLIGIAAIDAQALERAAILALLGGAVLLGYGFANLGLSGALPIPLTEMLLLPLVALAVARRPKPPTYVLVPLGLWLALVGGRLVFDYPRYGVLAIRDSTTAIESLTLLVGYGSAFHDGARRWARRLSVLFTLVFLYALVYPWRGVLGPLSPTVGLQRPESLVGQMRGINVAFLAGALFFATFTAGSKRFAILVFAAGMVGVFQARTLYILFPLSLLVLGWALRRSLPLLAGGLAAVVIGLSGILVVASVLDIQGRRGPVDPSFILAHLLTVTGREGPWSGTIEAREDWTDYALQQALGSTSNIALGVGLGPDLTGGHHARTGQAIRQPHNQYLETFVRTGIVGLMLFLWLLGSCLVPIALKARQGNDLNASLCAWILGASVVYLGVSGAQALLAFPYGSVPLFFWLGMGVALATSPCISQPRSERRVRKDQRALGETGRAPARRVSGQATGIAYRHFDRPDRTRIRRGPPGTIHGRVRPSMPWAERFDMLDTSINTLTRADLHNVVSCAIATKDQCVIANHNLHSLYLYHHDEKMRTFFHTARYTIVDGMSVVALARLIGWPVARRHRLTCLDYVMPLLEQAAERDWRVFYVGSKADVLQRGAAVLKEKIPALQLATHAGYFDRRSGSAENEHAIREINAFAPNILLVGMGMPRQEHWLCENLHSLHATVVLTTGGFMDYIAGAIPTPPRWSGRLGLEWLARLCAEPERLWRRYLLEPWFILGLLARASFGRGVDGTRFGGRDGWASEAGRGPDALPEAVAAAATTARSSSAAIRSGRSAGSNGSRGTDETVR